MHWPDCFLQIDSTKISTAKVQWATTLPPFLSLLTSVANLALAVYIFGYTRKKNDADTKIKWFLELVYTPNKDAVWAFFDNLQTIRDHIPKDGNFSDQQRIDLMTFIKGEESKFRQQFVNMLEIVAPDTFEAVDKSVEALTTRLTITLDNDELKLENPKTYSRVIAGPIMQTKGEIIKTLFDYRG
jgi:hypothetical protein